MIAFRGKQVGTIPSPVGVYALCDLDEIPVYVGQSTDGIRARVQRHLTSARSDVIANRQIDVWEIAYVWAWPLDSGSIDALEAHLFHEFNSQSPLMNGTVPTPPAALSFPVPECQRIQVIEEGEIAIRQRPEQRLSRQAEHYARLVDHILKVKDTSELRRSLEAHFERLQRYHASFLEPSSD